MSTQSKLLLGDNVTVLRKFPRNSVDLTVTSPPYDQLRDYNGYSWDFEGVANQLYRVTKEGGVVVWVVGDSTVNGSETLTSFKQALYFASIGFNVHDTMIYNKNNPVPTGGTNRYYQQFEYMFVLCKGKPKTFNPILVPRSTKYGEKRTHRIKSFTRDKGGEYSTKSTKLNEIVKIGNIWNYNVGGGHSASDDIATMHPAIFPEKLASDHIKSWSNEGDIVLDPFMGSGTTGKMAINAGRKFVGIELSLEYYKLAQRRIKLIPTKKLFL